MARRFGTRRSWYSAPLEHCCFSRLVAADASFDIEAHDNPFGGKLEALISPGGPWTTLTNLRVFKPPHRPPHRCSLSIDSSSRRSGIQNPDCDSFCSESIRASICSWALEFGRPGRCCSLSSARASSSRAIYLKRSALAEELLSCDNTVPQMHEFPRRLEVETSRPRRLETRRLD